MQHPALTAAQLSVHLKSLRRAKGLTQAQLGSRIGVKQTRIADIEKKPGSISVEQLLLLLHALDTRLMLAPAPSARVTPRGAGTADW